MKVEGKLIMKDEIDNLIIPSGPVFPPATNGELFLLTQKVGEDYPGVYVYNNDDWSVWTNVQQGTVFPQSPALGQMFLYTGPSAKHGTYIFEGTVWVALAQTTGSILQVVTGNFNAFAGTTTTTASSTPTIATGTRIWSSAITITTGSRVLLSTQAFVDHSNSNRTVVLLFFRNNTLIGVAPTNVPNAGQPCAVSFTNYDEPVTPGVTYTYSCRCAAIGGGSWYLNQDKNGNKFGGGFTNSFSLTEII